MANRFDGKWQSVGCLCIKESDDYVPSTIIIDNNKNVCTATENFRCKSTTTILQNDIIKYQHAPYTSMIINIIQNKSNNHSNSFTSTSDTIRNAVSKYYLTLKVDG